MIALTLLACLVPFAASARLPLDPGEQRLIAPVRGSLMLASEGNLPECVLESFLQMSGGATAEILLLYSRGQAPKTRRWEDIGAASVEVLHIESGKELRSDEVLFRLLGADGIWIGDVAEALVEDPLFASLIANVLERDGAVGGAGEAALALAGAHLEDDDKLKVGGLGLLPDSVVHLDHRSSKDGSLRKALEQSPGSVGWGIPKAAALVVHHGRKVGAMGTGELTAMVVGQGAWPELLERTRARDVVDHGDLPPYNLDLLALRRAAWQRTGPVFPPETAPTPGVERGTLILQGGGGVCDETFDRFIEAAGGKKARIVCIPSADDFGPGEEPDSYSYDELRERGCKNLFVLHTTDPEVADEDETFLEPLTDAQGVWIDGGRTYRVMDSFQHTRAHRLMFEVLKRGGVVGGSSAGGQVIGDFLVRGNPRTNNDLVFEGYTTGLGFLKGVIVDAHFRQRDRGAAFEELMEQYPQMLGIGIDAETALVVVGSTGEVLGENAVSFYDFSSKSKGKAGSRGLELRGGDSYDLKRRKQGK